MYLVDLELFTLTKIPEEILSQITLKNKLFIYTQKKACKKSIKKNYFKNLTNIKVKRTANLRNWHWYNKDDSHIIS